MRIRGTILFLLSLTLAAGCNIINPAEQLPTYVQIDSFTMVPTPNTGTSSSKITNVWVYLDYAPLGAFDLPAKIPVLADKPSSLLVLPGVAYSGLNGILVPYPFYRSDSMTLVPSPGQTVTFNPQTSYLGDSALIFTHEDFESGNSFGTVTGDTLRRTNDPAYVFEGVYGGLIRMQNSTYSESIMNTSFQAPAVALNKNEVYLELNYKSNIPFQIGVQTNNNGNAITEYLIGFNARDEWNKVYVGLQDMLNLYPNKTYRIAVRISTSEPGDGFVAFDNFKVVSRK